MSETKNELETLLEQAATEPAHRPAFFRTLLESTVWVPGTAAEGEQVVEDSALDLLHWGERRRHVGDPVLYFARGLAGSGRRRTGVRGDAGAHVVRNDHWGRRCSSTPNCRPGKSLLRAKSAT